MLEEFFKNISPIDWFNILASFLTVIMFINWLLGYKESILKFFSLRNAYMVSMLIGAAFIFTSYSKIAIIFYAVAWACQLIIFFRTENAPQKKFKSMIFNLIVATSALLFVVQASMLIDVIQWIESTINIQGRIIGILESQ